MKKPLNAIHDVTEHDMVRHRYEMMRKEKLKEDAKKAFKTTNKEMLKDFSFKLVVSLFFIALFIVIFRILTA